MCIIYVRVVKSVRVTHMHICMCLFANNVDLSSLEHLYMCIIYVRVVKYVRVTHAYMHVSIR
jgi:hypothetical protein